MLIYSGDAPPKEAPAPSTAPPPEPKAPAKETPAAAATEETPSPPSEIPTAPPPGMRQLHFTHANLLALFRKSDLFFKNQNCMKPLNNLDVCNIHHWQTFLSVTISS